MKIGEMWSGGNGKARVMTVDGIREFTLRPMHSYHYASNKVYERSPADAVVVVDLATVSEEADE